MKKSNLHKVKIFFICFMILLLSGCAKEHPLDYPQFETGPDSGIKPENRVGALQYTIQAGAFKKLDNALKLTENLNRKGLQAYYFVHESGLYKVRFGNYATYQKALNDAEELYEVGYISDYYIVKPEEFVIAKQIEKGDEFVRQNLIATAERFLGIPYKWGGSSSKTGFDCSGLSMVVYKINGINLPRNSRSQFKAGQGVRVDELRRGDLVFFATDGLKRVSHVGIYRGGGEFIHAPKKGKKIEVASLNSEYFKRSFVGAKTYL